MKVTETGLKAVNDPKVRAYLLDAAITQLVLRKMPRAEFEEGLRFVVATYLAATPYRSGYRPAMGDDEDFDAFESEQTALIEPVVQDIVERALATQKEMGL